MLTDEGTRIFRNVLLIWLLTRILVFAVGFIGVVTVGYATSDLPPRTSDNEFLNLPARWDAGWYVGLAHGGYQWRGADQRFANVAFFPAYPYALRFTAWVTRIPSSSVAWNWAAVALSNALFLLALFYVRRLAVELAVDDPERVLWLISAYPFAIFFGLPYTESLFLLASVGSWFYVVRDNAIGAVGWGLVAGLVRPNGWLLSVPLLIQALSAHRRSRTLAVAALAPAIGMLLYSAYVWTLTGQPFAWATAQEGWGRVFRNPALTLADLVRTIAERGLYQYLVDKPYDVLNGAAFLFSLAAVWPIWRTLGPASAIFVVLNVLPQFAVGGLPSMGRYTAPLFPLFIWLAKAGTPSMMAAYLVAFSMVQAIVATLFFTWREIF